MPTDVRELLQHGAPQPLHDLDIDAITARGRQWHQRRTATTAATIAAIIALAVLPLPRLLSHSPDVLFGSAPEDVMLGTWASINSDGLNPTMDIRPETGGRYLVVINDDAGTVCSGIAATTSGTDQADDGKLRLAVPQLDCDYASLYVPPEGTPLEEARDYRLVLDEDTTTLTDSAGLQWQRPSATAEPSVTQADVDPKPTTLLWPQSSLKETRQAQRRAAAGDPAYAWQVDPALAEGDGPFDPEIFTRFLTEKLGWDEFMCCEEGYNDSLLHGRYTNGAVEQEFIRCGDGSSNPMYPDDPKGRACPPTSGDREYEMVRLSAYQPVDNGPDGIWVITSSEPGIFRQTKPLSSEEVAEGVEAYLQARVDGTGVESEGGPTQAGPHASVPLLYATSDGSPYEQFDYDVVGPTWPFSIVYVTARMFADLGQTVVEQPFVMGLDHEVPASGTLRPTTLTYAKDNFAWGDRMTTENGVVVPEPYFVYNTGITLAADPRVWDEDLAGPHGPETFTLVLNNDATGLLAVVGDPLTPTGTCEVGYAPPSADALIRKLRSSPNLSVSEPQITRLGSTAAVQVDITAGDDDKGCVVGPDAPEQDDLGPAILAPRPDHNHPDERLWWGVERDKRARLYALDMPGTPSHTIAILVMAPASDFEAVLDAAQPVLDSFRPRR